MSDKPSDRAQTLAKTLDLIEPFNKKGVAVTEATRFAQDLEWDSLTVLDFVANIEDEFDVIISMNMQAEIETVGQLVDADMNEESTKLQALRAALAHGGGEFWVPWRVWHLFW